MRAAQVQQTVDDVYGQRLGASAATQRRHPAADEAADRRPGDAVREGEGDTRAGPVSHETEGDACATRPGHCVRPVCRGCGRKESSYAAAQDRPRGHRTQPQLDRIGSVRPSLASAPAPAPAHRTPYPSRSRSMDKGHGPATGNRASESILPSGRHRRIDRTPAPCPPSAAGPGPCGGTAALIWCPGRQ